MKHCLFSLILFFTTTVFAQTKDTRAVLDIHGRVKEISVSPDEKIWLVTRAGNIYYTNNIDSNWHYWQSYYQSESWRTPDFDKISFFNTDTAILTGYIIGEGEEHKKNGLYITKDGGESWELINFKEDSWIYTVFVDKTGKAWMGGSAGQILYSNDFGQHWEKRKSPYNSSSRTNYIFMLNENIGISGALDDNKIYATFNNWVSYEKIRTPLEQFTPQKHKNPKYSNSRIEKVLYWNNFIVVNQNGFIYYSDIKNIDWKKFPIKIIDFELDSDSKELFALTDNQKVVLFSSPTDFITLPDIQLVGSLIDMEVINHSLFILSSRYEIYKVNKNEAKRIIPYTTDRKISQPEIIKKSTNLTWGVSQNQIYLSDTLNNWYRENALDFDVADVFLLDDSTAILWDGKNNYLYSLQKRIPILYYPENPLKDFFSAPIKSISINHHIDIRSYEAVFYQNINDSTLATTKTTNTDNATIDNPFEYKVNSNLLKNILLTIDSNPAKLPSLKDFQITEKDKKNYLGVVNEWFNHKKKVSKARKASKEFYYSIPSIVDTLNDSILYIVFNRKGWESRHYNMFTVEIVNENNDTITVSKRYFYAYPRLSPLLLPWKFEYKGMNFSCYNIEFVKYVKSCIPDGFGNKEVLDNKFLLLEIADYLRYKRK